MKSSTTKIPTSLGSFYIVTRSVFGLLQKHVDKFNLYKPFYSPNYVASLFNKLDAALDIPATTTSISKRKLKRIELRSAAIELRNKWQALKGYIDYAFDHQYLETQLEQAGWIYFMNNPANWGSVKLLGQMAMDYITRNQAALMANNNMPASFPGVFTSTCQDYNSRLQAFSESNNQKHDTKAAKAKANDELHEILSNISKDAAVVFRNDNQARRQFAFSYQLSVIRGGAAGLKGYITDSQGHPIINVSISSGKYNSKTDTKGYFKITRMSEGSYTFTISKAGYTTTTVDVVLTAATAKTIRIQMAVAMQAVA